MSTARTLGALASACLAIALAAPAAEAEPPTPLTPSGPTPSLPENFGKPAKAQPVPGVRPAPQNPQMAPDPKNNVHNDTWMTDNYTQYRRPARRKAEGLLDLVRPRLHHADLRPQGPADRLVHRPHARVPRSTCSTPTRSTSSPSASCPSFRRRPGPTRRSTPRAARTSTSTTRTGWSSATTDRKILVVERGRAERPARVPDASPSTTRALPAPTTSACPRCCPTTTAACGSSDASTGRSACSTRDGRCHSTVLNEEIENSFAMARDGAYIVTDTAHVQAPRGRSTCSRKVVWSARYRNTGDAEGRADQRRLGHDADADGARERRQQDAARLRRRSPTTPTRSTSSSTAPPTSCANGRQARWSAACRCSPRARARTRTR